MATYVTLLRFTEEGVKDVKYTGLDPEVSNFGNQALGRFQDVTPYPPSRQFFLTIATTF